MLGNDIDVNGQTGRLTQQEITYNSPLDTTTGEILSMRKYNSHVKAAQAASRRQYHTPTIPLTKEEVLRAKEVYGAHWYVLKVNLEVDNLLDAGLTKREMRILSCIVRGICHNNYSTTAAQDITAEYGYNKSDISRAIAKLISLGYIRNLSKEVNEVHPYIGWSGNFGVKDNAIYGWAIQMLCLRSEEYIRVSQQTYKGMTPPPRSVSHLAIKEYLDSL
tara:strand:- start:740 stop:1396 length:657 start_codon:yes stop_codon:yes gene_type:complete